MAIDAVIVGAAPAWIWPVLTNTGGQFTVDGVRVSTEFAARPLPVQAVGPDREPLVEPGEHVPL